MEEGLYRWVQPAAAVGGGGLHGPCTGRESLALLVLEEVVLLDLREVGLLEEDAAVGRREPVRRVLGPVRQPRQPCRVLLRGQERRLGGVLQVCDALDGRPARARLLRVRSSSRWRRRRGRPLLGVCTSRRAHAHAHTYEVRGQGWWVSAQRVETQHALSAKHVNGRDGSGPEGQHAKHALHQRQSMEGRGGSGPVRSALSTRCTSDSAWKAGTGAGPKDSAPNTRCTSDRAWKAGTGAGPKAAR